MSNISVSLPRRAFRPGEKVEGEVRWNSDDKPPKVLRISLLWFTEGKGSEDSETHEQRQLQNPSISGRETFSFTLPSYPWSFSGTLISLVWAIEASLDPAGAVAVESLVSAPEFEEIRL